MSKKTALFYYKYDCEKLIKNIGDPSILLEIKDLLLYTANLVMNKYITKQDCGKAIIEIKEKVEDEAKKITDEMWEEYNGRKAKNDL